MSKLILSTFLAFSLSCFAQTSSSSDNSAGQQDNPSSSPAQTTTAHHHHRTATADGKAGAQGSDTVFVKKAAEGGLAEVELGKLATEKASSDDVKQFGQRMVDDHSKANDQLKQVASQKNLTLPTDLNAKDKAQKDRLSKLSGKAFDRAYMRSMVMDHTKDVAEFKKEANSGADPDVKNFASQTLPTLQDHLKSARDVASKVGAAGKGKAKSSSSTNQGPS